MIDKLLIPLSIIFVGFMITGAILTASGNLSFEGLKPKFAFTPPLSPNTRETLRPNDVLGSASKISEITLREVSPRDHWRGSLQAPVKLVEFSDLECPFCKSFHPTLKRLMAEYGETGRVAWIYRHFPLDSLHPQARKEAEASECAAELGGNEKFWEYLDRLFEVTPSNNNLDLRKLPQIATEVGLDASEFQACLESGRHAARVAEDLAEAERAGGLGTPFSVIITSDGRKIPLTGALPYEQVRSAIENSF